MAPANFDATFIVVTPEDQGILRQHIQMINSHSAKIKHRKLNLIGQNQQEKIKAHKFHLPEPHALMHADENAPSQQQMMLTISNRKHAKAASKSRTSTVTSCTTIELTYSSSNANFDRLLQSTLDPFIKLPVQTSPYERGLLHEWLTDRGRISMPVSRDVFDPTIYAASHLLQADCMYVLVHVSMGEWMTCKRNGSNLSKLHHLRRGQSYKHMSNVLANDTSPFLIRVSGLIQLSLMELLLGESKLQMLHLTALWELIESYGGLRQAYTFWKGPGPNLGISFVSSFFISADIPIVDSNSLEEIIARFRQTIERMRKSRLLSSTPTKENARNASLLTGLRGYVRRLLEVYTDMNEIPYRQEAGRFAFVFSLAMTQIAYNLTPRSSVKLLVRLAKCLNAATAELPGGPKSVFIFDRMPCSASWLLWHVRRSVLHLAENIEAEIASTLVDSLRLLRYMEKPMRQRLAMVFTRIALAAIEPPNPPMLSDEELEEVVERVGELWSPDGTLPEL